MAGMKACVCMSVWIIWWGRRNGWFRKDGRYTQEVHPSEDVSIGSREQKEEFGSLLNCNKKTKTLRVFLLFIQGKIIPF